MMFSIKDMVHGCDLSRPRSVVDLMGAINESLYQLVRIKSGYANTDQLTFVKETIRVYQMAIDNGSAINEAYKEMLVDSMDNLKNALELVEDIQKA